MNVQPAVHRRSSAASGAHAPRAPGLAGSAAWRSSGDAGRPELDGWAARATPGTSRDSAAVAASSPQRAPGDGGTAGAQRLAPARRDGQGSTSWRGTACCWWWSASRLQSMERPGATAARSDSPRRRPSRGRHACPHGTTGQVQRSPPSRGRRGRCPGQASAS